MEVELLSEIELLEGAEFSELELSELDSLEEVTSDAESELEGALLFEATELDVFSSVELLDAGLLTGCSEVIAEEAMDVLAGISALPPQPVRKEQLSKHASKREMCLFIKTSIRYNRYG